MLVPDVNVFINARVEAAAAHASARDWLARAGRGTEPLAVPGMVLGSFVRIMTNPRMAGGNVHTTATAFEVCAGVRNLPTHLELRPGPRHWEIFQTLALSTGIGADDITDASLAAFSNENDATFVTFDRGFARFPGLKMLVPG